MPQNDNELRMEIEEIIIIMLVGIFMFGAGWILRGV